MATRPDCGGIYGSAIFGSRYYAGHIQCEYIPPIPPTPAPSSRGRANSRRGRPKEEDLDDLLMIIMLWQPIREIPTSASANLRPTGDLIE